VDGEHARYDRHVRLIAWRARLLLALAAGAVGGGLAALLGTGPALTWVVALACAVIVPVAAELTGRRSARRDGLP